MLRPAKAALIYGDGRDGMVPGAGRINAKDFVDHIATQESGVDGQDGIISKTMPLQDVASAEQLRDPLQGGHQACPR
ncbi:hypothetical protein PG995_005288 [Apiospora arundinis]